MMYDFKTTLTVGPGSAYDACTRIFSEEEAAKYPLTHVTHFMNGSEFISAKTVERFTKMFRCAPNAMAPGYGVSENVCLATFASQDYRTLKLDYESYQKNRAVIIGAEGSDTDASSGGDADRIKEIVSVGAPVKDLTVLIGNAKTHRVYPDLRIGEIFLGGTSVTDGYWQNPKDSRCFHSRLDGYDMEFYRTGDLGFLYEGHLYITGRIKEMIIVNGHNIYPSDLQVTIAQGVPALAGAAYGFFSVASDTKEQVIAVVESRPEENFALRIQEINKAVSDRFSFSFYDVVFVPRDTIPRTDNRKLQMLKARTLYLGGKLPVLYSSRSYYMKKTEQHASRPVDRKSRDDHREILRYRGQHHREIHRHGGYPDRQIHGCDRRDFHSGALRFPEGVENRPVQPDRVLPRAGRRLPDGI